MLIKIDESSERAIYAQIADSVRADISERRVGPGSALPSAKEVAAGLGINVHTVLRAYQVLRDEGLIDLKRRRGAVVTQAAAAIAELYTEVQSLIARASGLGVSAGALAALIAGSEPNATAPQSPQKHSKTEQSQKPTEGSAA